ncbi:RNAse P Rpr2/Rpp21/SNM1 subunit domain-containing protein [Melampsora americana]|nr:RNAse P Rpr2/Rpp21/SNM1 subunit domain-containing protein [Melampsora americana]
MAKKNNINSIPAVNPNAVPNSLPHSDVSFGQDRDVLQRLNFLHQAAHYFATASHSLQSTQDARSLEAKEDTIGSKRASGCLSKQIHDQRRERLLIAQPVLHAPISGLSRVMSTNMKAVARKAVVRMDPSVKRSICRSCNLLLVPGHTSVIRLRPSKTHVRRVSTVCLSCQDSRNIPQPPEPLTGADHDESTFHRQPVQARSQPFWTRHEHITFVGTVRVTHSSAPS